MKRAFSALLLLAAAVISFALFSPTAFAGVYDCSSKTKGGEDFSVAVNFNDATADKPSVYNSTVSLAGKDVPQLGASCFVMDRPSTRFVKCAHQAGNLRIEVYPTVETTSGALKLMQFIIWDGPTPQRGSFSNCTTK
jgi:hypothetical protein